MFHKSGCVALVDALGAGTEDASRAAEGVDGLLVLPGARELDKDGVFLRVFRLPAIESEGWGARINKRRARVCLHIGRT